MTQLLLETATDICSVAVARDGTVLADYTATEPHRHASHLTIFIREVMAIAGLALTDLDEIVLSDGPGSYTSLRVGAATAKGLCLALPGLQLRVVPTLMALALAAPPAAGPVLAVINSRRGEVYGQLFRESFLAAEPDQAARSQVQGEDFGKQGLENIHPLFLSPQNLRFGEEGWFERLTTAAGTGHLRVCGPGQERLRDHLPPEATTIRFSTPAHCSARHLLAPALRRPYGQTASASARSRVVDVAAYEPYYLNPPFVTKSKKKHLG